MIAVGINLIGGTLCSMLKLPLFLDTIGTLVVACLAGPWVAALTGLLTNLFLPIVANPVNFPYAIVSVLVGLTAGYMARAGFFNKKSGIVAVWLAVTLVNAVSQPPTTSFVELWPRHGHQRHLRHHGGLRRRPAGRPALRLLLGDPGEPAR